MKVKKSVSLAGWIPQDRQRNTPCTLGSSMAKAVSDQNLSKAGGRSKCQGAKNVPRRDSSWVGAASQGSPSAASEGSLWWHQSRLSPWVYLEGRENSLEMNLGCFAARVSQAQDCAWRSGTETPSTLCTTQNWDQACDSSRGPLLVSLGRLLLTTFYSCQQMSSSSSAAQGSPADFHLGEEPCGFLCAWEPCGSMASCHRGTEMWHLCSDCDLTCPVLGDLKAGWPSGSLGCFLCWMCLTCLSFKQFCRLLSSSLFVLPKVILI